MQGKAFKIVIAGAGITGLSAAYYTLQLAKEKNLPVDITLVEKSERLGGKIDTFLQDGFVMEKGPDSFLARKLPIIELTQQLGLETELVAVNPKAKASILLHQKLHPMPAGLVLGIPTQMTPFLKTTLLSPTGKARAALDMLLRRRQETTDESLGHFLERRLGREVVEHIAEPLLGGIYAGDIYKLSLGATFPQFQALEKKHGSLIRGMMASKGKQPGQEKLPEIVKKNMFLTYKRGLSTIVDKLEQVLQKDITILQGLGLKQVQSEETGDGYRVTYDNEETTTADGLILTVAPPIAAHLLTDLDNKKLLEEISYISVANVVLAFERQDIEHPLDGSGFVIPRNEDTHITACTWTSTKWLHTTPKDKALLRCYVGRADEEEIVELTDEELIQRVRDDLQKLMGITATPLFTRVNRWKKSMPQYHVGHLERLEQVESELADSMPNVYLAGAGYRGVGIPDCIGQGKAAALKIIKAATTEV